MSPDEKRRAHAERRRAYNADRTRTPDADAPAHAHVSEAHLFELEAIEAADLRRVQMLERVARAEEDRLLTGGVEAWAAIADPERDRERRDRLARQVRARAEGREAEPAPETTYNGRIVDGPEWQALTFAEKLARYGYTDPRGVAALARSLRKR